MKQNAGPESNRRGARCEGAKAAAPLPREETLGDPPSQNLEVSDFFHLMSCKLIYSVRETWFLLSNFL